MRHRQVVRASLLAQLPAKLRRKHLRATIQELAEVVEANRAPTSGPLRGLHFDAHGRCIDKGPAFGATRKEILAQRKIDVDAFARDGADDDDESDVSDVDPRLREMAAMMNATPGSTRARKFRAHAPDGVDESLARFAAQSISIHAKVKIKKKKSPSKDVTGDKVETDKDADGHPTPGRGDRPFVAPPLPPADDEAAKRHKREFGY